MMRVVELSLRAVAKCLGVTEPKNPNWGEWLNGIRTNYHARTNKWDDFDLFQDFFQRLQAIKDSQRNSTMHAASTYTEEEAMNIFKSTEGFMKKVASRMDENGLPLA